MGQYREEVIVVFEEILDKGNIAIAQEALLAKNESCGVDGMYTSEITEYLKNNGDLLMDELRSGAYTPKMVIESTILGRKGKARTITRLTTVDKLILRAIMQVLERHIAPLFHEDSYAFQKDKKLVDAVKKAAAYIENGADYVAKIDFENCFDNIRHDDIIAVLAQYDVDDRTLALIRKFLRCSIAEEMEIRTKTIGLVQGSPLSPLLCNIFLNDADIFFAESNYRFVRYADDINIYANTYEEALVILAATKEFVESVLHLKLNTDKSGVFPSMQHIYLGYEFLNFAGGRVGIRKFDRKTRTKLYKWRTSAITQVDDEYHLLADGILVKKDYSLLFENPEKQMHIPAECTECINIYSDITFSENFFEFASEKNLWINIFDKHGEYLGAYVPRRSSKASKTLLRQAAIYNDPAARLEVAKAFLEGAFHNMRENLKYYRRHMTDERLDQTVAALRECMIEADAAPDVERLMLIEARARGEYYACFNVILPDEDFEFGARTKRPPLDAINALISFGNTVLYRRAASAIYRSRLDIRIGFLHATNNRPESLNLDIAEMFRPVIVDRVIFSLINKEMMDETLHFERVANGGIYMNTEGKKIFLRAFEGKMRQRVKTGGRSLPYEDLLLREVYKLADHVDGKGRYKPYKYFL
jgi:group II intron reverse transcriptase/maturase